LFVDGRRAAATSPVAPGSVIEVFAPHEPGGDVAILLERDGLVFVSKPPGVATEPDHAGSTASVIGRVAAARGVAPSELHALSRLDVGVSGVVTLAATEVARRRLEEARQSGRFRRRYLALVMGVPRPRTGCWTGEIGKGASGRWEVGGKQARSATTHYRTVAEGRPAHGSARDEPPFVPTLLALSPLTGRTHQLRAHALHAGCPLLGDASYGGPRRLRLDGGRVVGLERVMLHAAWVELEGTSGTFRVHAPVPEDFREALRAAGGDDGAEVRAVELEIGR
jgi:23S rRNA-/tRNA-specific pseudouridylate synthase